MFFNGFAYTAAFSLASRRSNGERDRDLALAES
jgi:hypothetical protein